MSYIIISKGFLLFGPMFNIVGLVLMVSSAESKENNGKKFYNLHKIDEVKFKWGFGLVVMGNILQIVGTCFS
jgi:hypothetical protein